jgi:hypothetical protein
MNERKLPIRDKDLANVEAALLRAAAKARKVAEETHTPLVLYENGRIVKKFFDREK